MTAKFDFSHFLVAQDADGCFEAALGELRDGRKQGHWMWFVFPQIAGLGSSAMARKFALSGTAEACALAAHEELGDRLYTATEAMLEWAGMATAQDILGPTDAKKFQSSMTLFEAACEDNDAFAQALDAFFDGERDQATLDRL